MNIEFTSSFIDLRNKPDWYLEMVPTGKTPAARINGAVTWESRDILEALDAAYPDSSLLPSNSSARARAQELMDKCDGALSTAGYALLLQRGTPDAPAKPSAELQADFEAQLQELEDALSETAGPWFMEEFGLVDIVYVPALERLSVLLPEKRGYHIRGNPKFPNLSAWMDAVQARPAFRAVRTDPETIRQIGARIFRMGPPEIPGAAAGCTPGQQEAGAKLAGNHDAVVADVLKNAGLVRESDGPADAEFVRGVVELTVYNLAAELLGGTPKPAVPPASSPWGPEPDVKAAKALSCAAAAGTLAFLRTRVSSPRDMSADAAEAFRGAADAMLLKAYY